MRHARIGGWPSRRLQVPATVVELAAGAQITPVWENEVGGLTFLLVDPDARHYLKWAPAGAPVDLFEESRRLNWADPFTRVPEVLEVDDDETGSWLITADLGGHSAVSPRWIDDPRTCVAAIGEGLRYFHESLPVAACPFDWSRDRRVAQVHHLVELAGDTGSWHEEFRGMSRSQVLAELDDAPNDDLTVVCHGDACSPNTLIAEDGTWWGHVDLGSMGVGDRWADLAIAVWSCEWNYGSRWTDRLLAAYGTRPDPDRMRYYRLLWEAGA